MSIHAVIQKPLRITDPAIEEEIRTPLCFSESLGHFFGAAILNEAGTGPESLTGASVTANFIRGDGVFGTINGTIDGNIGYVILPSWCYRAQGRFTLTVFLNKDSVSRAIIIAKGRTMLDTTDSMIDPEHIVPSIAELLAQISACAAATAAANTAASNANTKADLADTAAANANSKASAADTAAGAANTAAGNANTAAGAANTAAGTANAAAGKIDNMSVAASGLAAGASPTVEISEVSGHKHIDFGFPKGDTGSSGVYYGTTAPTDPAINVWVNPNGSAADILKVRSGNSWVSIPSVTGDDGVTFTPSVSSEGVISWTNDGGRTNPQPVNIKGPKGDDGDVSSVNGISPDGNGNVTIPNATQSVSGVMSTADKTKLDGLPASAAVPGSISIIVDGDAAGTAVAPGQYAYIKNNTHGLAEGLHRNKSSSAFPTSGGTADSTVFEAVSGGGMNALKGVVDALFGNYTDPSGTKSLTGANTQYDTTGTLRYNRIGNMVFFSAKVTSTADATSVDGLFSGLPPSLDWISFPGYGSGATNTKPFLQMRPDGGMRNFADTGGDVYFCGFYFTACTEVNKNG